ncbi:MAG: thiamine ABC transporter substrate-binding protein [Chloroflexi bacterium]|nr:thiamine ABC transporter substrate-binding protein [Chloroflexota bacterium]
MKQMNRWGAALLAGIILSACAAVAPTDTGPDEERVVRLMSHDSFNMSEEARTAFEEQYNARLEFVPSGDAGAALNQAILSSENPLADAFFGVDNTFLSRAIEADIFVPIEPEGLSAVPAQYQLDPESRLIPIDWGDVCLNYDIGWFGENGLAPPSSLDDLIDPAYSGLTVVQNPATSSPGLAFLMATIATYGEGWQDYWASLRENDVLVTEGWEDAYYGQFTLPGGQRPIVVSYASSPPAELIFAEEPLEEAPTASVTADGSCFRQIEFAGVLRNADHPDLAQALIEFMLSETFQEDMPLQMFVFPVLPDANLPDAFVQYAQVPDNPATLPPDEIAANRDQWIEQWTEIVLR